MAIRKELLDKLLKDYQKPEDVSKQIAPRLRGKPKVNRQIVK